MIRANVANRIRRRDRGRVWLCVKANQRCRDRLRTERSLDQTIDVLGTKRPLFITGLFLFFTLAHVTIDIEPLEGRERRRNVKPLSRLCPAVNPAAFFLRHSWIPGRVNGPGLPHNYTSEGR